MKLRIAAPLCLFLAAAGCGQKGPLFLPGDPNQGRIVLPGELGGEEQGERIEETGETPPEADEPGQAPEGADERAPEADEPAQAPEADEPAQAPEDADERAPEADEPAQAPEADEPAQAPADADEPGQARDADSPGEAPNADQAEQDGVDKALDEGPQGNNGQGNDEQ